MFTYLKDLARYAIARMSFLNAEKIDPKDPNDFSYTSGNSTGWESANWGSCPNCLQGGTYKMYTSDFCPSCGFSNKSCLDWVKTHWRKIYNGEKWVTQIRHGDFNHVIDTNKTREFSNGFAEFDARIEYRSSKYAPVKEYKEFVESQSRY